MICSKNLLLTFTISSVIIGIWLGFVLRNQNLSSTTVTLINFPGEIFMQILKLMILPLIVSSLISGMFMNSSNSGFCVFSFGTNGLKRI